METKSITLQIDEAQLTRVVEQAVQKALLASTSNSYNKKEAARYLKISTVSLWTYQRNGWIKSIMVGQREMFTKDELDRFASGRKS